MAIETSEPKPAEASAPWTDMQHTGPGTLAGRYMRRFWHPVYAAEALPAGRAVPIRIMSEDVTLYRGETGKPHLLAFRCAHRGTQLSTGWVEGDDLRCFYHGWKYNPGGQCIEQPAEPEPFCERIRIRSYPVAEYLGLFFVYLGDGEAPPLPRYPDFEREEGRAITIHLDRCNFFNNIDNDAVHTWFVHRRPGHDFTEWKTKWNGRIPRLSVEEDEWGVVSRTTQPNGRAGVTHRGMPNMSIRKQLPEEGSLRWDDPRNPRLEDTIAWKVPVDDESFLSILVEYDVAEGMPGRDAPGRNKGNPELDPDDLAEAVLLGKLWKEDVDPSRTYITRFVDALSQVGQGRIADRSQEHLGATDVGVILLRKLWERELRALAEGRPLKQWYRPEHHVTGY